MIVFGYYLISPPIKKWKVIKVDGAAVKSIVCHSPRYKLADLSLMKWG